MAIDYTFVFVSLHVLYTVYRDMNLIIKIKGKNYRVKLRSMHDNVCQVLGLRQRIPCSSRVKIHGLKVVSCKILVG